MKETPIAIRLRQELNTARIERNDFRVSDLCVLIGELDRLSNKMPDDATVIKVIKSLLKSAESSPDSSEQHLHWIKTLRSYLPREVTELEIEVYIKNNINLDDYGRNRMKAIGPILEHFGSGTNGNVIKKVLMGM